MTEYPERRVLCIGCRRPHPYRRTSVREPIIGWWCEKCEPLKEEYIKWYHNHEEELKTIKSTIISDAIETYRVQEQLHSDQAEVKRDELFGTWEVDRND